MTDTSDRTHMYIQRLVEANEDMEEAERGIREFSHTLAVNKLLDCYFSVVRFDVEFKKHYTVNQNETDPYQLLALHTMLVKKQLDIDNALMTVNRNTIHAHMSVLKRLFTNNRAFNEVVSILNKATDLRLMSKTNGTTNTTAVNDISALPTGLSRFDMTVAGGFDTIIGQEHAIAKVRRLVVKSITVSQPLSIILYGPPGTGKTSMALAIGREYKLKVYTISVASLGGHFVGEREKNTADIFKFLEGLDEDVLLFIDEADSFLTASKETNVTQQIQYTRVVTTELFERFLRNGDGRYQKQPKARILLMATNFEKRIAEEIRHRSVMVFIDLPRTQADMRRLVDFYRNMYRINMTNLRLERIVRYALRLELAPSHLSQVLRRIATQVLLDILKRGIVVRKYVNFPKTSRQNPLKLLVLPVYTVGGTALSDVPGLRDTIVSVFNAKQEKHKISDRKIPLSGETQLKSSSTIPAAAIYPFYDGEIERFFRSYNGFEKTIEMCLAEGDGDSTNDPDYVVPDEAEGNDERTNHIVSDGEGERAETLPISLSTDNYTYEPMNQHSSVAGRSRLDKKSKRISRLAEYTADRATLYPRREEIKVMLNK